MMEKANRLPQDAWLGRVEREIERLLGGPLDARRWKSLGAALAALHGRFVAEQASELDATPYMAARASLAAYLAYFFPASRAQVARVLAELPAPTASTWRVLDVGSGPGPATVAVADWARRHGSRVDATALEASSDALQSLKSIWDARAGSLTTRTWRVGQPLPDGPFDVIVSSHVLNELFADAPDRIERRTQFALDLAQRLAPGGLLVLVEPALKRSGRDLLELRDRLLGKSLHVVAPCFFRGPCPALERPRDWCHSDRPWTPPALVERAGEAAGLARESLKFSYVVLTNRSLRADGESDERLFRIVSDPLPEKGKRRFFGCGPAGRHPLVRLDRERTETNAAFDGLERGDVVRFGELRSSGDGRRLGPETSVTVERPASALDGSASVGSDEG